MNEKIKEICIKAGLNVDPNHLGGFPNEGLIVTENFAKLIIQECIFIIENNCQSQLDSGVINNLGGLNQAKELIKKHFELD